MRISSQKQNPTILVPSFESTSTHEAYHDTILNALNNRRTVLDAALGRLTSQAIALSNIAARLVEALRSGHKVLVAGNGGSAAEAQHFAAELVGRFKKDRAPYAVLSLTTDTAILTAIANDYGYHEVFARQVMAFGQPNDMLLAFSTSGESENLLRAALTARERQMTIIAITGEMSNSLEMLSDVTLRVPLVDTALVQELHMIVTHILCDIVETHLSLAEEPSVGNDVSHTQPEQTLWQISEQDEWHI